MIREIWKPLTIKQPNKEMRDRALFVLGKHPKIRNLTVTADAISYEQLTLEANDD